MENFNKIPSYDFKIDCGDDYEVRQWLHDNGFTWSGTGEKLTDYLFDEKYLIALVYSKEVIFTNKEGFEDDSTPLFDPFELMVPRPHADMIKQWADDDSLIVETRKKGVRGAKWVLAYTPIWNPEYEYRFKPKKVTKTLYIQLSGDFHPRIINYRFFTQKEVEEDYLKVSKWMKVENSEKEFDV